MRPANLSMDQLLRIITNRAEEVQGGSSATSVENIADDVKLYFGNDNDAYIEYDEDGSDTMILGFPAGGGQILDDKKLYFGTNKDVYVEYDEDGNDTLSFGGGDLLIEDDKKLYFGSDKNGFIEYSEGVNDFLVISGSANGIVLSGSTVQIRGVLAGASPLQIAGGIEIVPSADGETTAMSFGDDIKLYFGDNNEASIRYDESGADYLVLSGSTASGIQLDGPEVRISGMLGIGSLGRSGVTHGLTLPDAATAAGKVKANAFVTYSSISLKNNVSKIESPINILNNIEGVTFNWKNNNRKDIGFIAEHVGQSMPEIVEWKENGTDAHGMDYTKLVPVLVEAIKEQQQEIANLRDTLDNLKILLSGK